MKPIPNFLDYSITKDGKVWSRKTNRWLKPSVDTHGYLRVALHRGGKRWGYLQ